MLFCERFKKKLIIVLSFVMLMSGVLPNSGGSYVKADTDSKDILSSTPSENVFVQLNGENVNSVSMNKDEKLTLSINTSIEGNFEYSWEILADVDNNEWVSIYECNDININISYGMLVNFLDSNNLVQLRGVVISEGDTYISERVLIEVLEKNKEQAKNNKGVAIYSTTSENEVENVSEDTVTLTINYLKDTGESICDPYIATIFKGMHFKTTVLSPVVMGYEPKLNKEDIKLVEEYTFDFDSVEEDVIVNIYYFPVEVKYEVRYLFQGIYDDDYDMTGSPIVAYGKVGDEPDEKLISAEFEGFTRVNYQPELIAADGSTVFQCFYDREYYLVDLDLDGGHGVDSVYAKYGTAFVLNEPKKSGWVFIGWDTDGDGVSDKIPGTIPSKNTSYKALWDAVDTTYTKVYWKENADDGGYSYWGSSTVESVSGSVVSGSDDVPKSISTATVSGKQVDERVYFTYNDVMTNKGVVVEGDGSTIVNIYYTRNMYTLYFKGISGKCVLEEHAHGDGNCSYKYLCEYGNHVHREDCLSCTLEGHLHNSSCCLFEIHTHNNDCGCSYVEHTHSEICCSLSECNNHGVNCYNVSATGGVVFKFSSKVTNNRTLNTLNNSTKDRNSMVVTGNWTKNYYFYDELSDEWYQLTRSSGTYNSSSTVVTVTRNCHLHGDEICNNESCEYGYEHIHSDDTCDCGYINHTHEDGCDYSSCGKHVHADSCYGNCNVEGSHSHVDSCLGGCVKQEHSHKDSCSNDSTSNIIYTISAKYDQTIGDVWATADLFPTVTLRGWSIDGVSSTAVSKRINMTSDLCDTSDGVKNATAVLNGNKVYLYYMFESFDQESGENGNDRIYRNGVYYDKSDLYYQEVNSSGNWNQKEIMGMSAVSGGVVTSGSNVFLYYNRNTNTISFQNISNIVKSVSNIMYGQPLDGYKDDEGNLLSSFVPEYPSTYEPNAFYFDGWYTTPECFPGTKVDFNGATMPNDDLILYASWKPVTHTVTFYNTYQDMVNSLKPIGVVDVLHGDVVESSEVPEASNEGYVGGEWFYIKNGEKVAYRPISIPVTKDLKVYKDWTSDVIIEYTVHYYKIGTENKIADSSHGWLFDGSTKTFKAKGGGELAELYEDYNEGWYPTVSSTSIVADKDGDNVVIFYYDYQNPNPYTVRYVDSDTGKELIEEKVVSDNAKSVVSEVYIPIDGYMPDAYYKQLVLALNKEGDEGKNTITFYYSKSSNSAYYAVEYYFMNTDGSTYSLNAKIQSPIAVGSVANIPEISTEGYLFEKCLVRDGDEDGFAEVTESDMNSVVVDEDGALIQVYYEREKTSYTVHYYISGTETSIKEDKVVDNVYFGTSITEDSEERLGNYSLAGDKSQTKELVLVSNYNVFTFYYEETLKTAKYVAVCSESKFSNIDFGFVSHTQDIKKWSESYDEVSASARDGFYFAGWYSDENLEQLISKDASVIPDSDENITYYALFKPYYSDLKISKSVDEGIANQTFVFHVKGLEDINKDIDMRVTIHGTGEIMICSLPLGKYEISEDVNWSWNYNSVGSGSKVIDLVLDKNSNKVEFINKLANSNWLSGDSFSVNIFE